MKARNKKTRWLLISLLFGLLAAAGLILTQHSGVRYVTTVSQPMPSKHAIVRRLHAALLAATGGKQTLTAPAGTPPVQELVDGAYSDGAQPQATGHSNSSSNDPTTPATGTGAPPFGGTSAGTPRQTNSPSSAAASPAPQGGAGEVAYNGYIPLDCGVPAGCGAGGNTGSVTRQPSLTGSTVPVAHNSQGSSAPNDGPDDPGQGSDPPGSGPNPSVAAAPELDPATLAGAVTLLLGALAILRGRRVRVARATRSRDSR
jgi:hypothetical protein